jgi:hypothetical protein
MGLAWAVVSIHHIYLKGVSLHILNCGGSQLTSNCLAFRFDLRFCKVQVIFGYIGVQNYNQLPGGFYWVNYCLTTLLRHESYLHSQMHGVQAPTLSKAESKVIVTDTAENNEKC